ncbi:hypothetical protein GQ55_7G021300 [Panicum hallii var. hallii]|uniref:C2H2-type domain-containing protein n=1 Tax=Panicum hallii var. hallii TaxID=1504633 RepID=A0A2T7CS09_9POAL|nr:hypothetical protein GQ55_7G021300 [Panicum hallii var. hallii]
MALATLLLPSSTASKAAAGDHSDIRRHDHHHGSKRKKKPPPSPQPSLSSAPRTPPGARSQRGMAVAASSKKSPKVAAAAAAKNRPQYQQHRAQSTKKAAATSSSSSSSSSWEQVKSLLSCRSATAAARVHDPAAPSALARLRGSGAGACGASLCAMRDVVDASSSAASSAAASASASADRDTAPLNRRRAHRAGSSSSSAAGAGHHSSLRGLSGCYECRAINVEPMSRRYPRPRELCACPQCGEVFTKADSLEHHQAIRHAVSELGPEDSGRNIVEIIFKSSWQKRDRPICHIDRILKVHNAPRTVARFEAYRDAVRSRCRATAARAAADGNELLRFHSAPLACALGLSGATSLCAGAAADSSSRSNTADTAASSSSSSAAGPSTAATCCGVCTAIRHGFAPWVGAHPLGVRTTASSGRAHDCGSSAMSSAQAANADDNGGCRAMLVCRVIAGRVRRDGDACTSAAGEEGPFDSVAGEDAASSSVYGNLEELFVANPRAILPCFVVIYRVLES